MDNFNPYNVLLAIATNIPVLLMTAFVLQGHILSRIGFNLCQLVFFQLEQVLYFIFLNCLIINLIDLNLCTSVFERTLPKLPIVESKQADKKIQSKILW